MERIILKSKSEGVEIHILTHGGSAEHADSIIEKHVGKPQSSGLFCGIDLDNLEDWERIEVPNSERDHSYKDGADIRLGDLVNIALSGGTTRSGTIKMQQQAYGISTFESGDERFTPLCCFSESVQITKAE